MREGGTLPLPLGWYVALMLEDQKPLENSFIQVKDKEDMPASATKGTFAVAWAHEYLSSLSDRQFREKYPNENDINLILEEEFNISETHIDDALETYGKLVKQLNNRELTPQSINPYFARVAISHVYIDTGLEPNDIWLVAMLADGTLLQCFRDGNFRAFTPNKMYEVERMRFESFIDLPTAYTDKTAPITHR